MIQRRLLPSFSLVLVACFAGCTTGPSSQDDASAQSGAVTSNDARSLVTVQLSSYAEEMPVLAAHGFDVAGVNLNTSRVDLILASAELDQLRSEGYQVVRVRPASDQSATGDISKYQHPETVQAALKDYANRFPALAQMSSIGQSVQGRSIFAMRITKDVATSTVAKPTVLLNGMHHARELMTAEVTLDAIDYLLTRYGTDPKVTHWVDANEIWVVPMLNVDGNNQVWANDRMWRKNTHGCAAGTAVCQSGSGVDINRNYPYNFAGCRGSSSSPGAEDYHGPSAGSEPETQALMNLVAQIRPVFDISYHSYSEVVLYPTGCQGTHAATHTVFEDIGTKMAALLPSDDGQHTYQAGTPWELLYGVDGNDVDWMYAHYNVSAFDIEVNSDAAGFQPSYDQWRDKTVTKTRPAWQLLLDRIEGSGIRGVVHDGSGSALAGATVTLAATTAAPAQSRAVDPSGTFQFVLLPGDYDLTVAVAGHAPVTKHVTVADARVDLDLPVN